MGAGRQGQPAVGIGWRGRDERADVMAVIEVAIGPGAVPGKFKVEVIESPAGHLSATAGLDAESLTARRGLRQQEVLASSVRTRGSSRPSSSSARRGRRCSPGCWGAGGVAGCYRASAALAAEPGEELRVVLRIDDPALAGLPWEAMFDHEAGAYVCRRDQLVRHVPVASVPRRCRSGRRCGSWGWPLPLAGCPCWTRTRRRHTWPGRWSLTPVSARLDSSPGLPAPGLRVPGAWPLATMVLDFVAGDKDTTPSSPPARCFGNRNTTS